MQLFLELTRRCDLQCNHCLRGDAQAKDMSDHIIIKTLQYFENDLYNIGFGGGEILLNPKYLNNFRHNLIWSDINTKWLEPIWLVTNGIRVYKEKKIQEALINLSQNIPITLAISTDSYHPEGAQKRLNWLNIIFKGYNIKVVSHGPSNNQLVSMGRANSWSPEVKLYSDDNLLYVNVNGDVYPSCDLSYNFMDKFKNTPIHLGNINTHTSAQIIKNSEILSKYINHYTENNCIYLTETWNGFEDEDLDKFNKLKNKNDKIIEFT